MGGEQLLGTENEVAQEGGGVLWRERWKG